MSVTRDGNGYITSITAREVKLVMDAYNPSGTQYNIHVYRMNPDGTVGAQFITYTIKQYGGTGILIIKNEGGTCRATRLEQSGSTWTLYDWRASDANGNFTGTAGTYPHPDKRTVTSTSGSITTTNYGITDGVSTPTIVKQKTFTTYSWGKELTNVTWGPGVSQAPSTSYTYHVDTTGGGWPRAMATMVEPTGKWARYDYFNTANDSRGGLVQRIYRPWLDAPTSPASATTGNCHLETYDYANNFDGSQTAPASRTITINGTEAGKTTWTYTWSYAAANSRARCSVAQRDYSTSSNYLTTTTIAFRPDDSVGFFQNKPHCITRPDGTRDSYAYFYGTWNAGTQTFSQSDTGEDRLVLVLHGQSSAGTGSTLKTSWTVGPKTWNTESTHLFANLSTITETVIDRTGHVVFSAENLYTGGSAMERISGAARTFNANNLLQKEVDITRTVAGVEVAVNYTYAAGQLASRADIDGTKTSYTYDDHLRLATVRTADGGSGSYPAKTQTFTYNLGDLKATAQECDCSPTVTTYQYETTGRLMWVQEPKPGGGTLQTSHTYNTPRQTTVNGPSGETLITTLYYDGRIKSETGTGRVPTTYSHAVGTYAVTRTTHQRIAAESAYPWIEEKTDGLGRVIEERSPQAGWSTSANSKVVRKTHTYNATTGQLAKVAAVDEAAGNARLLPDHLYVYLDDSGYSRMGLLLKEGDDLGSNGYLDAGTTDRITLHSTSFSKDTGGYNGWIRNDLEKVYRTNNNASDITTVSDRRTRFTRFNNGSASDSSAAITDVVELDASGRWSVSWEWVNPTARTRTRTLDVQGAGQGSTVWQDGYLKSETSLTGVTKTYAYNTQGLLASVTEATTGSQTSYAYHSGTSYAQSETMTTGASTSTTAGFAYYWKTTNPTETTTYKVRRTDGAGKVTYTEHDQKGRLWHVWGTGAAPSETGYDSYGRRNLLKTWRSGAFTEAAWPNPAGGDTINWTVDAASGAVTTKTYPNSSSVGYTYNAAIRKGHALPIAIDSPACSPERPQRWRASCVWSMKGGFA